MVLGHESKWTVVIKLFHQHGSRFPREVVVSPLLFGLGSRIYKMQNLHFELLFKSMLVFFFLLAVHNCCRVNCTDLKPLFKKAGQVWGGLWGRAGGAALGGLSWGRSEALRRGMVVV